MSSGGDNSRKFLVGTGARRELRNLLKNTKDPAGTIQSFQKSHSLHSMMARGFGTTPKHKHRQNTTRSKSSSNSGEIESLDTDSVLKFLFHLGVSQHEVHKRVSDALRIQLEGEIRKVRGNKTEALLNLLRSCWQYSTTVPELRPVLWAVLKQLGSDTPVAVLERLAERDGNNNNALKHAEVWHPLPPLLKRLVWEADWDKNISQQQKDDDDDKDVDPMEYLKKVQSTLFGEKLQPLFDKYCSQTVLVESANKPFVASTQERQMATTQRRALKINSTSKPVNNAESFVETSKVVSELRKLLSSGDSSPAYRPKLLQAALLMLMAHHGTNSSFVGGSSHLHATLALDILLSGPLPKAYQPILSLARTLDEVVKVGKLSDGSIAQIQSSLRGIFPQDSDNNGDNDRSNKDGDKKKKSKEDDKDSEVKLLLKRVIMAALDAMKEADPQSLFLNPVTDTIAPGYSKVIKKPMCIKQMEQTTTYTKMQEWEQDVQLMFRNCMAYNTGASGKWFRDEANRQRKVFKEEILPQAKKHFASKLPKVTSPTPPAPAPAPAPAASSDNNGNKNDNSSNIKKRKAPEKPTVEFTPLVASKLKKRKKDDASSSSSSSSSLAVSLLSMEALASMLLSDPFVMRLLLDRILRSLRIDTWKGGSTLPVAHRVIPSLLQLVQLAQMSTKLCAIRGKRYMIPGIGVKEDPQDPTPYQCLRQYTPLLLKLFLESEMDKRMASDLKAATQSLPTRRNVISVESWKDSSSSHLVVVLALVQGGLVHVCQPGNSYDQSLAATFPKFAGAIQQLAKPNNLWDERPFYHSLIQSLSRHKAKLGKTSREAIAESWMGWLRGSSDEQQDGAMCSAAHECFLSLLNEWTTHGNVLVSRDDLVKIMTDAVEICDKTERKEERKFIKLWKEENPSFQPVMEQYQRLLKVLPESHSNQWKEAVGVE